MRRRAALLAPNAAQRWWPVTVRGLTLGDGAKLDPSAPRQGQALRGPIWNAVDAHAPGGSLILQPDDDAADVVVAAALVRLVGQLLGGCLAILDGPYQVHSVLHISLHHSDSQPGQEDFRGAAVSVVTPGAWTRIPCLERKTPSQAEQIIEKHTARAVFPS